jgi:hypothetical protein
LTVSAPGVTAADSAFLTELARAFAYRWQTPSRKRQDFTGWRGMRNRTLPPEPRWADDWSPTAVHRAHMRVVLQRNGRLRADEPDSASGDRIFDSSLRSIAIAPMPKAPELPPLPADVAADSVVLFVTFGDTATAEGPSRTIFFAAAQRPVEIVPGTLDIVAPRTSTTPSAAERRAIVKYDVTEDGTVPPLSIEILQSSDRELANAISDGLRRARFRPAESNCRPIAMTVVQRFGY